MRQEQYISANALMTTAAYHGALDAAAGLRPVATANVTLAEFRHWAALVPARACMHSVWPLGEAAWTAGMPLSWATRACMPELPVRAAVCIIQP